MEFSVIPSSQCSRNHLELIISREMPTQLGLGVYDEYYFQVKVQILLSLISFGAIKCVEFNSDIIF